MVASNTIYDRMEEEKDLINVKYQRAQELFEEGVITERLGGYLKALLHMRSCLNIARLFAERGDYCGSRQRFWEANLKLREICYVYGMEENGEFRENLALLAEQKFDDAGSECDALLGVK